MIRYPSDRALKVSADYLIGLSDVKDMNADAQAAADFTGLTEKAVEYLHSSKENDGGVLAGVNYLFDATPGALHGVFSPIATAVLLGSMPPESENRKIIAGSLAMTPEDLMHYWAARAGDQVKAITLEQAKHGGKGE